MPTSSLPWPYRLYRPLHNQLTRLGAFSVLGRHPSVVVRNRLNRLLYRTVLRHEGHATVATKAGFQLCIPLFDQAAASILFEREYAPEEARTLLALAEDSDGAIDIGANLGYFSCLLLSAFRERPAFRVIAVEPNPDLCFLIRESFAANHVAPERSEILHAAVGDKQGQAFFVWERSLSSNAQIVSSPPSPSSHRQAVTDLITLDSILARYPSCRWLVKIDVEGAEMGVLQGGRSAFEQRCLFWCEISSPPAKIAEILKAHQYATLRHDGEALSLFASNRPKDVVFVPQERVASIQSLLRRASAER